MNASTVVDMLARGSRRRRRRSRQTCVNKREKPRPILMRLIRGLPIGPRRIAVLKIRVALLRLSQPVPLLGRERPRPLAPFAHFPPSVYFFIASRTWSLASCVSPAIK